MARYEKLCNIVPKDLTKGHLCSMMLDSTNGALGELKAGVSVYDWVEYAPDNVHPTQEVMYILEGKGTIRLEGEEFQLEPEMAVIVQPGIPHSIKRNKDERFVKLFWVQAPVGNV